MDASRASDKFIVRYSEADQPSRGNSQGKAHFEGGIEGRAKSSFSSCRRRRWRRRRERASNGSAATVDGGSETDTRTARRLERSDSSGELSSAVVARASRSREVRPLPRAIPLPCPVTRSVVASAGLRGRAPSVSSRSLRNRVSSFFSPRRKSRTTAAHGGCARKGERLDPLAAAGSASLLEDSIVRVGFRKVSRNRRRVPADCDRRATGTPSGQRPGTVSNPVDGAFRRKSAAAVRVSLRACVYVCARARARLCLCACARVVSVRKRETG